MADRRTWLTHVGMAALASTGLSACGFQLQKPLRLTSGTLAVAGLDPRDPLAQALRRQLSDETRLVSAPAPQADVVLAFSNLQRQQLVLAKTAAALVRSVRVTLNVTVRITDGQGQERVGPRTLAQVRDISYNEGVALAKEQEIQDVLREMETEVARQLVQQVAALAP